MEEEELLKSGTSPRKEHPGKKVGQFFLPRFKSQSSPTLETCNFEALEGTGMYFTILETSNLLLFGQEQGCIKCIHAVARATEQIQNFDHFRNR